MKSLTAILALLIVAASISAGQTAFAQSTQLSSTISLNYVTVQVSYPSEVLPGQAVTVNFQATAKDGFRLISLGAQIYYADGNNLRQLATATIGSEIWMASGDKMTKDVQITVPADAPRTSVITLISEKVRVTYYDYSYYYYPYLYYPYVNYSYYYYVYYYPVVGTTSVIDDGIAPLSYIKATTPEYVSLQAEYKMLQQKLTQTQAENQKLQQDLQAERNNVAERNSMIADLNQQLASAQGMIRLLEVISAILAAVTAVLGVFLLRGKIKLPKKSTGSKA